MTEWKLCEVTKAMELVCWLEEGQVLLEMVEGMSVFVGWGGGGAELNC